MKGTITAIEAAGARMLARVQLEGDDALVEVEYWPELLEQWGADVLRAHLVHQAVVQRAAQSAPAAAEQHAALIGAAEAAPGPEGAPAPADPEPSMALGEPARVEADVAAADEPAHG
jgi:hypothetical protein